MWRWKSRDLAVSKMICRMRTSETNSPWYQRPTLSSPSAATISGFLQDLSSGKHEEKTIIKGPDTLKLLSIQCLLDNKAHFLHPDEVFSVGSKNPFAKIANSLVQEIANCLASELEVIDNNKVVTQDYGRVKPSIEIQADTFRFLLQLLNPQMETFDFELENCCFKMAPVLFQHLLAHCPQMKSIVLNEDVWNCYELIPRTAPQDIFRLMSLKWSNLTDVQMTNFNMYKSKCWLPLSASCTGSISKNLPLLRSLSIAIPLKYLTFEEVQGLRNLEKLEHLRLHVSLRSGMYENTPALVQAIDSLAALESVTLAPILRSSTDFCHTFVQMCATISRENKLTVNRLCFQRDVSSWPKFLALEDLEINCTASEQSEPDFTNLSAADLGPVQEMCLVKVSPSKVCQLVQKFGSALQHLRVQTPDSSGPLDVCRVVAACPKVHNLKVLSFGGYLMTGSEDCKSSLQNCKKFDLTTLGQGMPVVTELFNLWLLSSKEVLPKFEVKNLEQLEAIHQTLDLGKTTCLDKVETLGFRLLEVKDLTEPQFLRVLQLVLRIYVRSPKFDQVIIRKHPKWFSSICKCLGVSVYFKSISRGCYWGPRYEGKLIEETDDSD